MSDRLRVLAVSAPYWPCRSTTRSMILGSRVPFSLQNACRLAAGKALSGQGVWGASNWKDRNFLNSSVVMYDYADDLKDLQLKLKEIKPNLLLIGAMTLALPGAVEIAKMARKILGNTVTIVLGGKHVSETFYRDHEHVRHHPGSPLRLMNEGKIPRIFDVVVSGDGEHVIVKLGELVANKGRVSVDDLNYLQLSCPGNWIAGSVKNGNIKAVMSVGLPIDYTTLPIPAETFGFVGSFTVFGTDRTAHVYSDISRGCMYDCFFCTERSRVNGTPQLKGSAYRLARQLKAVAEEGKKDGDRVSAFVEDSILLMGKPDELEELHELLGESSVIPFGGQITMDLFLRERTRKALKNLTRSGLCYVYAGMETANEVVAQSMSKNIGKSDVGWVARTEDAIKHATKMGIKYGVAILDLFQKSSKKYFSSCLWQADEPRMSNFSAEKYATARKAVSRKTFERTLLFGLGENQADRVRQLRDITKWQKLYSGNPCVVSLNWATQHPLLDVSSFDYTQWGTSAESELLPYFQEMFGEASERYPVIREMPTVHELKEIRSLVGEMRLEQ